MKTIDINWEAVEEYVALVVEHEHDEQMEIIKRHNEYLQNEQNLQQVAALQ